MTNTQIAALAQAFTREQSLKVDVFRESLTNGDFCAVFIWRNVIDPDGDEAILSFLRTNIEKKANLIEALNQILGGLGEVEPVDLRDTVGGMQ